MKLMMYFCHAFYRKLIITLDNEIKTYYPTYSKCCSGNVWQEPFLAGFCRCCVRPGFGEIDQSGRC